MEGDQDIVLIPAGPGVRKLLGGLDCPVRIQMNNVVEVIGILTKDGVCHFGKEDGGRSVDGPQEEVPAMGMACTTTNAVVVIASVIICASLWLVR